MSTFQDTDLLLIGRGNTAYKATVKDFKDDLSTGGGLTAFSFLGSHWTTGLASADGTWRGVCWSPKLSLWLAVCESGGGQVMTSPDGYTWTARTALGNTWHDACWSEEKSLFVAVGASSTGTRLMTSPDGITWTEQTITPDPHPLYTVCWAKEAGKFVALGSQSGYLCVKNSVDGITWTNHTTIGYTARSICWSPKLSRFVAAGSSLITSTDGQVWTSSAPAGASFEPTAVCWSEERSLFVCVGQGSIGYTNCLTSTDGTNWTAATIGQVMENNWRDVVWVADRGIFVAATNGKAATSPDGKIWTLRPLPVTGTVVSLGYSPQQQKLVATYDSSTYVCVSPGF